MKLQGLHVVTGASSSCAATSKPWFDWTSPMTLKGSAMAPRNSLHRLQR
jgi:hypothetical protein